MISGIGGLGHIAVQYARGMGLNVAAVDIDDGKLALATRLAATVTVNANSTDPVSKERDRRRPRRAGHGRFSECLRPSARHGTTGRHHLAIVASASFDDFDCDEALDVRAELREILRRRAGPVLLQRAIDHALRLTA